MVYPLLFSSFDIWKPEHVRNSSDELLAELQRRQVLGDSPLMMRRLPVDTEQATHAILDNLLRFRPRWAILGGMAETRSRLTLERRATSGVDACCTPVNLWELVAGLPMTDISYDAGSFVCNATYYRVLSVVEAAKLPTQTIFLHVPQPHPDTWEAILSDCEQLLQRMMHLSTTEAATPDIHLDLPEALQFQDAEKTPALMSWDNCS